MKAIFYVLALLVIGGAAYFTLELSNKFKAQQTVRLETITTNKSVSANADATESDLKKETAILIAAETKKEELTQSISALKSTAATLERDLAEVDNTLKSQDDEFTELDKTLKQVQEILKELGNDVTLDNLAEKIQIVTDDKKKKEVTFEELTTNVATAEKKLADFKADLDRLVKRDLQRNSNIGTNSREAVISSVDQDWGFVVIGSGSNSGFAPQGTLIVKRDGQVIGRLRPSSIEPSQTIAEIDFPTLSPGVRIQPGDRVIPLKPVTR
jgi:uncharacterized coiled-coil protein SlyX